MYSAIHTSAEFPNSSLRPSTGSGTQGPRPKVLLVDDEPHVLAGAQLALRGLPCEVRTATCASSALALLGEEPCNVIVADERMPGMRGTELLAIVAREFPACARIMLTGHASARTALRAINDAGVAGFLLKPCSPDGLRDAVRAALTASRAATAGARVPDGPRLLARNPGSMPDFVVGGRSTH